MYVSNFLMQQVKLCRDFYYRWKEGVLYLPVTAIDKSGRGLWSRGEKLYVDFCTMVSCFFREFYNSFSKFRNKVGGNDSELCIKQFR